MDVDDLLEGDVACRNVRTDAAAVDERDIRIEHEAICVGAQVAEIGLMIAHPAVAFRIVDCQQVIGVRNDGVQKLVEFIFDRLDVRVGLRIVLNLRGSGEQLHRERAVRLDRQLADVCELRAGLAVEDFLAVLVRNLHTVDHAVAVTVDERVETGGVRNDFGRRPGLRLLVDAHVADCDDVVRAVRLRRVDRRLNRGVDACAGIILAEAVDVLAGIVHEVGRGGLGDRFGGGDTDERDLLLVDFDDLVRVKNRRVLFEIHEVCGEVRILGLLHQNEELIHAVVELVVAERCEVVTDKVHDVDDRFAVRQGADRSALHVVARVDKEDFVAFGFERLLEVCNACIAPAVADAAVHVVREQNDRVTGGLNNGLVRADRVELIGVDRSVAAHTVYGECAAVELDVLRFAAVLRGVALDKPIGIRGVGRFELEQRVSAFFRNKLDVRTVRFEELAVRVDEGVANDLILALGCLHGQDRGAFFGVGERVAFERSVERDQLMLFVVVEVVFGAHDLALFRIEENNFVACIETALFERCGQRGCRVIRDSRVGLDCGKQDKHHQDCQDQRNGFSHVVFFPPCLFELLRTCTERYISAVSYTTIIKDCMSNSKYRKQKYEEKMNWT